MVDTAPAAGPDIVTRVAAYVSAKPDGRRIQSANGCVRFQHKGKRTCRGFDPANYRLATQRAKQLVASVR